MYYCLICKNESHSFLEYGEPPRKGKCPKCKAKPRNRSMAWFLKKLIEPTASEKTKILEVGASKIQTKMIINSTFIGPSQYIALDIRELAHHKNLTSPYTFQVGDAASLSFENHYFDYVLCNYVLQDAPLYQSVLSEIHRTLKPEGLAVINVAIKGAKTKSVVSIRKENPSISEDYFEENGHHFHFGEDFIEELVNQKFKVKFLKPFEKMMSSDIQRNQVKPGYTFILCSKSQSILDQVEDKLMSIRESEFS